MSFVQTILAQIRGDNGETGARVRKNKARNAQVGQQSRRPARSTETIEELKPIVTKRFRKKGSEGSV
jgi:hypothetical protein